MYCVLTAEDVANVVLCVCNVGISNNYQAYLDKIRHCDAKPKVSNTTC